MTSMLETELQATFDSALTALELDQCGACCLESYHTAASHLRYVTNTLIDSQDPLLWLEACNQIYGVLQDRIEVLGSGAGTHVWQQQSGKEERCTALAVGCEFDQDAGNGALQTQLQADQEVLSACSRQVTGSLSDVAGLQSIKQLLREAVILPLRFPALFTGMRSGPRNVLLFGAPGTGKTLLVDKLAAEGGLPLLCLAPSSVLSKWAGDSEKTLKKVFSTAKALAQSNGRGAIVFIDEIDALACQRTATDDRVARRVLTELLIQLSAVAAEERVFVIGATNRPMDLDPALMRRFDRRLQVPLPDAAARVIFFAAVLARPELAAAHTLTAADLSHLAHVTDGCTGSDMQQISREAAMRPVREALAGVGFKAPLEKAAGDTGGGLEVTPEPEPAVRKLQLLDFLEAVKDVQPAHSMYSCEE